LPSTFTQPFSIHSSASRREQRPSSLMRFDRRGSSGFSWRGGRLVMGARTAAGASGVCRVFCNCARIARDDGAFGAAVETGDFVILRVIRAMGRAIAGSGNYVS